MAEHYIDVTSNQLLLTYYNYDRYLPYPPISIRSLGKLEGEDSFYIMRMLRQPWATKELLYELASHIKQLKPKNSINWESTFAKIDSYFDQEGRS
ncbi:hypothetical protein H8S95_09695 [Pontibacter sp. KCTC 32443]|uniref:hypothetical protein n=1 Tax=Pontibacter TaxID=323449 RepID=UPI00164E9734|nr:MULTISPECIES: hypothetical protein [Pontibacter]MBC5774332.1 hypothetical protein [Pontibacter sp. KCTC 32443]